MPQLDDTKLTRSLHSSIQIFALQVQLVPFLVPVIPTKIPGAFQSSQTQEISFGFQVLTKPSEYSIESFLIFTHNFQAKICVNHVKLLLNDPQWLLRACVTKGNVLYFTPKFLFSNIDSILIVLGFKSTYNMFNIWSPVVT